MTVLMWTVIVITVKVSKAMGCYYRFFSCQETCSSIKDIERVNKNREMDHMRPKEIKEKG